MKHPLVDSKILDMDGLTPLDLAEMWDKQRILKKLTNCYDIENGSHKYKPMGKCIWKIRDSECE